MPFSQAFIQHKYLISLWFTENCKAYLYDAKKAACIKKKLVVHSNVCSIQSQPQLLF